MGDEPALVLSPEARVDELDDVARRFAAARRRYLYFCTVLALSVPALLAVFLSDLAIVREGGLASLMVALMIAMTGIPTAAGMVIASGLRLERDRRSAETRRVEHLAAFQWFEVWAHHPSAPATRPRHLRHRSFLQLFVHPDPAVPRYLTQGTDLVVTGGCTSDDLRVVTAHLDVLLHRALFLGFDDPRVRAAIRRVPRQTLLVPYGRRQWEVHDPAAARALLAPDLASGWPPSALVARCRELLAAVVPVR